MPLDNLLQDLPADLSSEVFTDILSAPGLRLERIVSKGHTSSDWYDQPQAEWVMVVQGSATIEYDNGECFDLIAGSFLNIPARQKHKVTRTDDAIETVWLALHYAA